MQNRCEEPSKTTDPIDVSAAFQNCFFHCYALHLLSNNLPLPNDLWSFQSILGEESKASLLQPYFQKSDRLTIANPSEKETNDNPNALFENTLILGILFREWFATKLAHANDKEKTLQGNNSVIEAFNNYKEFRSCMEAADLYLTEFGALYESNTLFLEQTTPISAEDIRNYWKLTGHTLYCKHIARLGVTVSPLTLRFY